jgi:ferredoxin
MCEFCVKHGEGQKWYLMASNYSRELLAQQGREQMAEEATIQAEERICMGAGKAAALMDRVKNVPLVPRLIRRMGVRKQKAEHWWQVLPLEDAEQVVDLVDSIVRLPCVCRQAFTGREVRCCFALGLHWADILGKYPDFSDSLEVLDKEEAKKLLRSYDRQGLVHSIFTFRTPLIGGLCNCDQDCIVYRLQVKTGVMQAMFRAEYVGLVDWELCDGCKKCLLNCRFGAIHYSYTLGRPTIDMTRCYGCGVCRAVCDKGAITLKPRADLVGVPW